MTDSEHGGENVPSDPTRPTIFVDFTQAEANGLLEALAEGERRMGIPVAVVRSAIEKIREAQSDEDIRSALMENCIIEDDYDPLLSCECDAPFGNHDRGCPMHPDYVEHTLEDSP